MFHANVSNDPGVVSVLPISTSAPNNKRANTKAAGAEGAAWAEVFLNEEYSDLGRRLRRIAELHAMSEAGRKGVRIRLNEELDSHRFLVRQMDAGVERERARAALKSFEVRVNEVLRIAQAIDLGMGLVFKEGSAYLEEGSKEGVSEYCEASYADVLARAREVCASDASAGPTRRRGRPSKAGFLKLCTYATKLEAVDDADKARITEALEFLQGIMDRDGLTPADAAE